MENIQLKWNKDLSKAPYGLILIKIAISEDDGLSGNQLALAYQIDGIKGDFYVHLPNNGNYQVKLDSILEWSFFEIISKTSES